MAKLPKNKYGKGCTVYGNDKKKSIFLMVLITLSVIMDGL